MRPKISVCIPNFNYSKYIGETITSVLSQSESDLEVLVSDNASTDNSVEVVKALAVKDCRLKYRVNQINVGFFGNLSRAASMATGEWMNMLSSDDVMAPGALQSYLALIDALGDEATNAILCSSEELIDGQGKHLGVRGRDQKLWAEAKPRPDLSNILGAPVFAIDAALLLRRSLLLMRSPIGFCATVYPKRLHDAVEGYSQGGLINPDKQFAWSILARAQQVFFIDKPLFKYRTHASNQNAQQASSGALKMLVDEYVASFSLPNEVLAAAGLTRARVEAAYIEQDIALRGWQALGSGRPEMARRIVHFGMASYPVLMRKNRKVKALQLALLAGPAGTAGAKLALGPAVNLWRKRMSKVAGHGSAP